MKINEILSLTGNIKNYVNLSRNVLEEFSVSLDEIIFLKEIINIRFKNKIDMNKINEDMKNILFLRVKEYPLPAFVSYYDNKIIGCMNINVFHKKNITNIVAADIESLFLYTYVLYKCFLKPEKLYGFEDLISTFFSSIFITLYRKRSNLLIDEKYKFLLKALLEVYVNVRFYGKPEDNRTITNIFSKYFVGTENVINICKFDDFNKLMECINKNGIINISGHKFSNDITKYIGVYSIPMFDDVTRFFSTIIGSSVRGNSLFLNPFLLRSNKDLYFILIDKISNKVFS